MEEVWKIIPMYRDVNAFRERFQRWKAGEQVYDRGRIIHARFGLDGEEETDAVAVRNRQVPIEVQERWSPAFAQKRQQALEEANARNLAQVLAANYAEVGPQEHVPQQLQEYYANKEDTRRFMERKQKGEELADKIFGTAFDIATLYAPAAKATLTGAKVIGKGIIKAATNAVRSVKNKISIDDLLGNPMIQRHGVNPNNWQFSDVANFRNDLFPRSQWPYLAYDETLKELYARWSGSTAETPLPTIMDYINKNVFDILPRQQIVQPRIRDNISTLTTPAKIENQPIVLSSSSTTSDRVQYIDDALNNGYNGSFPDLVAQAIEGSRYPYLERSNIIDALLDRMNLPKTSYNKDKMLEEGINFIHFDPPALRPREAYRYGHYDAGRIANSVRDGQDVSEYVQDALHIISPKEAQNLSQFSTELKNIFIKERLLDKEGNALLTHLPYDWNGDQAVFDRLIPDKARFYATFNKDYGKQAYKEYVKKFGPRFENVEIDAGGKIANVQLARGSRKGASYFGMSPEETMKKSIKDFEKLLPGESWALLEDGSLSFDSYTLQEALSRRYADKGVTNILYNKDGTVSMQKLNHFAEKRTFEDVKRAVQNLSKRLGVDLPEPYKIGNDVYAPNFYFTRNLK